MTSPIPHAARSLPTLLAAVVSALDAVDDHVVVVDEDGRVLHVNVAWQRFALDNGWEDPRWIGMDYLAASSAAGAGVRAEDEDPITTGVRSVLAGRQDRFVHEYDCHAPDELRWFRLRASKVDAPGIGAVITHTDVTHRRLTERALERHATRDELTGLANRASVQQSVSAMLHAQRAVGIVVVTLEDATDLARPIGDVVLEQASALLRKLFPAPAVTGRYAHHQLVAAIAGTDASQLAALEEIVQTAFAAELSDAHGVAVTVHAHAVTEAAATAAVLDELVMVSTDGRTTAA